MNFCGQFSVGFKKSVNVIADFQQRFSILKGLERLFVRGRSCNFLSNHNYGKQNELQERLGNPCNERCCPAAYGFRQANERQDGKGVGAPHRRHAIGNFYGEPAVKPSVFLRGG